MRGDPIEAVKVGVRSLVSALRQDPHALECVHLSLIAFDRLARVICPLTPLDEFQMPVFDCPDSGPTHLGHALSVVSARVDAEVVKGTPERKGDWRPLLFIMTDGSPSDLLAFDVAADRIRNAGFASIIACAAGMRAQQLPLRSVADHVVTLDTMDSASFRSFFRFVSDTISSGAASVGVASDLVLPPAPDEINVIV